MSRVRDNPCNSTHCDHLLLLFIPSFPLLYHIIVSKSLNPSPQKLTADFFFFCEAGNTSANAQDSGVMDAVFAAGFLLVVSGLGLGTTAFAIGEGCLSAGMRALAGLPMHRSKFSDGTNFSLVAQFDSPTVASSAAGSTLDIRLVRDHYVSICLPATVLSSAAVFSLVYCCLTLL